ncbi:MAG TPA: tetratricopeptide repeat protein, partial [Sandaracinaceae bacterium LLY-WYZ-13_1]|nr:tetratricopeptide repeat protein [Sandaracinaceae bacterium LLY-WYZ-13_1]
APTPDPSAPSAADAPVGTTAGGTPGGAARPLYLEDHEAAAPPPRGRSRSGLWVALVVLLAAAVGVALGWREIAPMLGLAEADDPANPHAESGDEALARDTIEGYEEAVHEYTQALAYDEHDAEVLTRLSRSHAAWAQALAFDASDLEARADEDPALMGEANAIRREQQRHATTALERAEDAVRHGSGSADAEVALSDALRLTGDLSRSRSRLERALTLATEPSAEALRVQALVEAAEAGDDLATAHESAEAAVAEDPGLLRARLLLARSLLAARDVSGARGQVDAILRRASQHPRATALREAIEAGRPPAPPTVDVPDGGVADAGEAADETPPRTEGSEGAEGAEASGGAVPRNRDYSWYIRQGDERLERGDVRRASELYEAARRVRPGGSEALTGLGYVALENGDANGAASRFRQAAGQGYAEAYIGLGTAYRRLGRTRDALTAYERYLERLPSGPRASIARRQADELRRQLGEEGGGAGGGPGEGPAGGGAGGGGEPPDEGSAPEPDEGESPPTETGALPAPEGMDTPPPQDVPAVDSEP